MAFLQNLWASGWPRHGPSGLGHVGHPHGHILGGRGGRERNGWWAGAFESRDSPSLKWGFNGDSTRENDG